MIRSRDGGGRGLLERATPAQVDRYTAAWRKLLDIKGQPPSATPGIELESDRPEWGFIKGELRWSMRCAVGPAAQAWYLALANPLGSGILVTILKATLHTTVALVGSGANGLLASIAADTVIGTFAGGPMDTRWIGPGSVSTNFGIRGRGNVAALAGILNIMENLPDMAVGAVVELVHLPVILDEGEMYAIHHAAVATAPNGINATFSGYVRPRNAGELTPG